MFEKGQQVKVECAMTGNFKGEIVAVKKRVSTVKNSETGKETSVYNKYIQILNPDQDLKPTPDSGDETSPEVRLHPNRDLYHRQKDTAGKTHLDIADYVANQLREMGLDEVYQLVVDLGISKAEELRSNYSNLNNGMQRMNLGNKIRHYMEDCGYQTFNEAFKDTE